MSLDSLLLELLACPIDKQALLYLPAEGMLYNPRLRRSYRVADGIPVLLADQGHPVTEELHAAVLRRAAAAAGGPVRAEADVIATLRVPLADVVNGYGPQLGDAASALAGGRRTTGDTRGGTR